MLSKCRAIVLRTVDYSESSVVLKCYTDQFGLQSYMVNGVRGRKGSIRPSQLQMLNLLELEAYHQQNKNLQRIRELKCAPQLRHLHYDVIKSSVGIFIAELLAKCIREENQQDGQLFEFLFHAIQILDLSEDSVANFPCYFMLQLTRYLGFAPKMNHSAENNAFDLKEGYFTPYQPANPDMCSVAVSGNLADLYEASFAGYSLVELHPPGRSALLLALIRYYQMHIMGFTEMNSNRVLSEVLA
jgi:DNA repair protein RecO (recombination protein O)